MATFPQDNKATDADLEAKIQTIVSFINGTGKRQEDSSSEIQSSRNELDAKVETIVEFINGNKKRRKDALDEFREVF